MKKQFFVAVMALVLGTGFTACSSDDLNIKDSKEQVLKASTYMSVSFQMPVGMTTRAADDGQNKSEPDFNNKGKWGGQDKVKKVAVYVFSGTTDASTLETKREYNEGDLAYKQGPNGETSVNANTAFKTTPGQKTVFVVVNPTTNTTNLLEAATVTNLGSFKDAYASANLHFDNPTTLNETEAGLLGKPTRADELAAVEGTGSDSRDVIVMTGAPVVQQIEDNVSEQEATSGLKNRANLAVQRAVARVLVTTRLETYVIHGIDPVTNKNVVTGYVENFKYVVGQGEKSLYFLQRENPNMNSEGTAFLTPAFNQVPSETDDYWTSAFHNSYKTVGAEYDYSGLWKNPSQGGVSPATVRGISVKEHQDLVPGVGDVTTALTKDGNGEFVLPTLHVFNKDRKNSGYRKGNTAYILIRGIIRPQLLVDDNGDVIPSASSWAGRDLYLGANGVFYTSAEQVVNEKKYGVKGQTARLYKGGKVLYFVWLNPDDIQKAINSPVIRNNIYHVHIRQVSRYGANWNPLVPIPNVPTTPNIDPKDPHNPINDNPNNPDPRPDNPYEPVTPPVDPKDPLSGVETWMSVNVNILPWQVHSYEIDL